MEAKNFFDHVPLIPRVTSVSDYRPYRHCKLFVQSRYKEMIPLNRKGMSPTDIAGMMNLFGYKNRSKFLRRLQEWQDLWGKIP